MVAKYKKNVHCLIMIPFLGGPTKCFHGPPVVHGPQVGNYCMRSYNMIADHVVSKNNHTACKTALVRISFYGGHYREPHYSRHLYDLFYSVPLKSLMNLSLFVFWCICLFLKCVQPKEFISQLCYQSIPSLVLLYCLLCIIALFTVNL